MMKYRIEIGAQAQSDITDIMRYIGQVLFEPRTAGNLDVLKQICGQRVKIESLDYEKVKALLFDGDF